MAKLYLILLFIDENKSDMNYSIFSFMCMISKSLFVPLSFISWSLCCLLFFYLRILITPLVSFSHCVVCYSSIYGFWLPLWYLQTLLTFVIIFSKCSFHFAICERITPMCLRLVDKRIMLSLEKLEVV